MTIAVIHQPQYLPYLGFFHKLNQGDIFVVMDSVQFMRRGIQHRNKIKTQKGEQWLTVPVFHQSSREEEYIKEVQIDSELPWARKHWNTLLTNYSPAPYFDKYAWELQQLLEKEWHYLCELDMVLIEWIMEVLGIKKQIVYLSDLAIDGTKSELLIDVCKAVDADTYLSGSGGKRYMDLSLFESAGINVIWQEFNFQSYNQLFPELGFLPNLSIIDTLFCCGLETRKFLGAN
ncbi:WbqC family protein [Phormidium sp. LEGE 05292]|uniref:WbqC family protein n=1 Tax=[Phormidium] sp. LEGE 05292 TaxID=767427 RepID=UPI00187F4579|nr:WbqC family protein [Phormidium sp. LEGE 05292]MBE9223909.1 WbqC family protein [Phormidium sp. LEGE 05292]